MSAGAKGQRERTLQRIDAALERLSSGDFGYCVACGNAIAMQRLEDDPAASLCTECAANKRAR